MALSYKYLTSGGFELAGSADNLASILHYYQFQNNNLDSFGFFDLVGSSQYQAGIVSQAVLTSKFLTVSGTASKNGAFFSGNSFTFCMWFKIGSINKDQNVFYFDSPDEDLVIKYSASTKKIYFNSLSNPISSTVLSGTSWYFVCIKKTGSNVYVQLNNETPVSYAYNHTPIRFNSVVATDLDVISPTKYSALYWDDVRFYKYFLRSEEISYIYNSGKPFAITGGDQSVLWDLPAHYYSFDNLVNDEAGSANLTLAYYSVSGGTSPIVDGKFNNCLQVGNTYDLTTLLGYDYYGYTSYNGNILGSAGESYSIAFWIKRFADPLSTVTPQISILSILTASNTNIVQFGYNGKNIFKIDDGTISGATIELSALATTWNHFGIVYNNDQGRYTFYLNGVIFGEISAPRSLLTAGKFYLGWDGITYSSGNPYLCQDVLIDDLRIYNFPITGWDFIALYTLGSFSSLEKSLSISFNMGTLPLKGYQVESYDFYEDSSDTQIVIPNPEHKLRIVVQQIWARSVDDVCKKIKALNYYMNIKSISVWSNNLVGPYGGGEAGRDQYGYYVDIPDFCQNSECVDFCIGVNALVTISATAFASSSNDEIIATGGFDLTGSAVVYSNKNKYVASGSFELVGSAAASQTGGIDGTSYTANGGFELTGSAGLWSSDQGTLLVETGGDMVISDITPLLKNDGGTNLVGSAFSSRESICDCLNVPYIVQMSHNLTKSSELTRFALRNNLSIPTIVSMVYSSKTGQYTGNIRLQGLSSFVNASETWTITFNLYCTGELNQFANRYNWILNLNIKRFTVGFDSKETNVIVYLLSSYICPQSDSSTFRFTTSVNLSTLVTQINNSSFINSTNFNDRIGLFLSDAWLSNPNLVMSVGA